MEGNIVHKWNIGNNPRLLPDGILLDQPPGQNAKNWFEYDWDGKTIWTYTESRTGYRPHHDWTMAYNPKLKQNTFMYIAAKTVTQDEAVAAGAVGSRNGAEMDTIVEVDMKGNIIWEWRFMDHIIQDVDATKANYVGEGKKISDYPGRLNINMPGDPLAGDQMHCNSMDYNEDLDQVVTNAVNGEFYVIDHGNTFVPGDLKASMDLAAGPKGDFLYRFGDPARYNQGTPPSVKADWTTSTSGTKQIGGSHDIQWIKKGLPGAGNFLVFNNGQYLFERWDQSYAYEINPYLDKNKTNTGKYVNPPDAGYTLVRDANEKDTHKQDQQISNQIVWKYSSKVAGFFASHIGGSAQRLPNGNTLICADTTGHFFEVDTKGTVVWDYINPIYKDLGAPTVIPDVWPMANGVFRALRYTSDDPYLKGKTLTSIGPITANYKAPAGGAAPAPAAGGAQPKPNAPAAGGAAQPSASGAQPKPSAPAAGGGGGGGGGAGGGGGGAGGGAPVPTLTGVSPNSGPIAGGTVVTIAGNGLGGPAGTVTFGGVAATAISQVGDPPSYQCTTPAHAAGVVDVVLTNGGGTVTSTGAFTYK